MVVFALLCAVVSEATWITGGHSINKVRLMDLESEVHTTNNHSWGPTCITNAICTYPGSIQWNFLCGQKFSVYVLNSRVIWSWDLLLSPGCSGGGKHGLGTRLQGAPNRTFPLTSKCVWNSCHIMAASEGLLEQILHSYKCSLHSDGCCFSYKRNPNLPRHWSTISALAFSTLNFVRLFLDMGQRGRLPPGTEGITIGEQSSVACWNV